MAELLERLCSAFGPSSCEDEVRDRIIEAIKPYATSFRTDKCGNLVAFRQGKKRREHKMLLSAHMDEVGFMVTAVSNEGFVLFDTIGGIDRRVASGRRIVLGDSRMPAVVAAKAIHLQTAEERGVVPPLDKMFIDIGCRNRKDTLLRVSPGDVAVFEPNFERFGDRKIKSKAIDDRFGCWALCELIKREPEYDTYFAFVTAEEEGCRGAMNIAYSEHAEQVVVVEGTTAGDIHGAPESRLACILGQGAVISFMDNGTVYDPDVVRGIVRLAEENGVKYQLKNLVAGGNDAQAYQRSAFPAKVAAISAPVRYIHSACSVADERDFEEIIKLLGVITDQSDI